MAKLFNHNIGGASSHEVKLVENTLDNCLTHGTPEIGIGDKACDSDDLEERLLDERGICLIAPHKQSKPQKT